MTVSAPRSDSARSRSAGRLGAARTRRGIGFSLAAVLVLVSLAGFVDTWRQATVVSRAGRAAQAAGNYEDARFLVTLAHAERVRALRDPGDVVAAVRHRDLAARFVAVLNGTRSIDPGRAPAVALVLRDETVYLGLTGQFFTLTAAGQTSAALTLHTDRIGPLEQRMLDQLGVLTGNSRAESDAAHRELSRQSRLLRLGAPVVLCAGLLLLGLFALMTRSFRRTVENQAAYDPLTGLPNRTRFQSRCGRLLAAADGTPMEPAVLLLDLDEFKQVNDTLGHHVGDQLLVQVAARLLDAVRAQDSVARLGGDEFALLIADGGQVTATQVAERITENLRQPFVLDGVTLDIEASIGIAVAADGDDVLTLVRRADTAMYVAKRYRLGHAHYTEEQDDNTMTRLTLLSDLRRALDGDEFELHYQPKIALDTGQLIGVEALTRWRHPTRGLLYPDAFIAATESSNLCYPFTVHVLEKALRHTRAWADRGVRLPVAVNVSTRCLLDNRLPEAVAALLHSCGVPAELLCLEITEGSIMANPEQALDILGRIRALGVMTSIDDFGTGYSSMAYLKLLPVDELKIDRSFVSNVATDPTNAMLVQSTIDLGHNLGLSVTAEGVEDAETLAVLRALSCDVAQGYYFARPLTPEALGTWMAARKTGGVAVG